MAPRFVAQQQAPDFEFVDVNGNKGRLSDILGEGRRVALVFLRYVGCPICQMRFWELEAAIEKYHDAGAELLVVIQSTPATMELYQQKKPYKLRVIPDPDRRLFELYGVQIATWGEYVNPAGMGASLKATFKGYRHGKWDGVERQKPGAFLIDTDGRFMLVHYGRGVSDNLGDEEMLVPLRQAAQKTKTAASSAQGPTS
ncbi:MAG: AhpC/TSA family protein [Deltaproteobacteria bacterium]|nr:AhpC/TSA family protein [Deltaproteobacteria bacterium]MCB9488045.1 AhpC/TSA family protein [Deltaproteobacteria bacterium]